MLGNTAILKAVFIRLDLCLQNSIPVLQIVLNAVDRFLDELFRGFFASVPIANGVR
jgi:hypothetical protein